MRTKKSALGFLQEQIVRCYLLGSSAACCQAANSKPAGHAQTGSNYTCDSGILSTPALEKYRSGRARTPSGFDKKSLPFASDPALEGTDRCRQREPRVRSIYAPRVGLSTVPPRPKAAAAESTASSSARYSSSSTAAHTAGQPTRQPWSVRYESGGGQAAGPPPVRRGSPDGWTLKHGPVIETLGLTSAAQEAG